MDPALFYKETRGMETGGVLLFDEIEKADPGVLDVLLTVFDEGYVKTSVGKCHRHEECDHSYNL